LTDSPHVPEPYDFDDMFRAVTLDAATVVPAFDPTRDTFGVQKDTTDTLAQRVDEALTGTEFWYRAAETGQPHVLRVSDDAAHHSFLLDLGNERAIPVPDRGDDGGGYTHLTGATLQSLFDADLLFGSSFGLWVSNADLLGGDAGVGGGCPVIANANA
jgi:hypothetical protein